MLSIISFLIVFSILILIHELGHFLVARLFKVKADEFGYGLPPRITGFVKENGKWKRVKSSDRGPYKNTIWSLNWLPIGGFVRIKGEQGEGSNDPDAFHVKPVWQRFLIISAGVVMNWLLAIVLLSVGLAIGIPAMLGEVPKGAIVTGDREVMIVDVVKGGVAEKAGIESMDTIITMSGKAPTTVTEVQTMVAESGFTPIDVVVRRGKETKTFELTSEYLEDLGKPGIGVALGETGSVRFPVHLAFINGVKLTWDYTVSVVVTFARLFRDIFTGGHETLDQISGPIGIASMTGKIAQRGFMQLLNFAAILSVNLAVLNFLPIPALDGGRAVFLILEAIRRKPIRQNVEALIHNIAFLLLIGLVVLISVRDVWKFFG